MVFEWDIFAIFSHRTLDKPAWLGHHLLCCWNDRASCNIWSCDCVKTFFCWSKFYCWRMWLCIKQAQCMLLGPFEISLVAMFLPLSSFLNEPLMQRWAWYRWAVVQVLRFQISVTYHRNGVNVCLTNVFFQIHFTRNISAALIFFFH